jgi:hypothetical protein
MVALAPPRAGDSRTEIDFMKATAVLLVLTIAVAVGYLLGTESGRERRELILVKLGRTSDGGLGVESITDIIEDAPRV